MKVQLFINGEEMESYIFTERKFITWMKYALELGAKFENSENCVIAEINTGRNVYTYLIDAK